MLLSSIKLPSLQPKNVAVSVEEVSAETTQNSQSLGVVLVPSLISRIHGTPPVAVTTARLVQVLASLPLPPSLIMPTSGDQADEVLPHHHQKLRAHRSVVDSLLETDQVTLTRRKNGQLVVNSSRAKMKKAREADLVAEGSGGGEKVWARQRNRPLWPKRKTGGVLPGLRFRDKVPRVSQTVSSSSILGQV